MYKKFSKYRDLFYNNQIKKQNENCKENYKSFGIIDTLNQILCIKNEENCPLNNNNNYKGEKKIIGNIILNHKQPCFSTLDKLWKKISSKEAGDGHLKYKKTIKNMENDNKRNEKIGQITYKR